MFYAQLLVFKKTEVLVMAAIKRSSMKDQVYELIRERIFSQYYKPGEEIEILTL